MESSELSASSSSSSSLFSSSSSPSSSHRRRPNGSFVFSLLSPLFYFSFFKFFSLLDSVFKQMHVSIKMSCRLVFKRWMVCVDGSGFFTECGSLEWVGSENGGGMDGLKKAWQ